MPHANRKPKGGEGGSEGVTGSAQSRGLSLPIRRGCAVRRMLALGILVVAVTGVAGPLTCDSGGVARAEEAPPALKKSDRLPFPPARETAWDWPPQSNWRYMPEHLPRLLYEKQRGPLRGDFWTKDEIKELFDPPATFGR